ncbi:MAG: phenylacetate--CoA ligase [Candidatus Obscuribacterales bacterium]|nr:phenylacetate--CoA ligase [Candidatus Obscuribacterales bacterium]
MVAPSLLRRAFKEDIPVPTERLESTSRAELESLQLKKLRESIRRASASPHYRELFKRERRLENIEIQTLTDLSHFPLTSKREIRDRYPHGMLAVPLQSVRRFHASSGTRGKPTLTAYTDNDLKTWAELCARSLHAAGVRPGDVLHNAFGYGLFTGGIGIHYGAEALGANVIPASGGRTSNQLMLLQDLSARVLCCTPSYALNLACAIEERGLDRSGFALVLGIFGAEPWSEPMRQCIEKKLQIKAVDIYGMSELTGPGVSVECLEARQGLHIWEDHFLAEVIDPHSGRVLDEGEEGELVITTLSREASPLLRFRTGDLTSLDRSPCICGRIMTRMTRVRARLDDMLIVRGVNVYPSEIENILLGIEELAPHYQLILRREKALDELRVQVEAQEHISAQWTGPDDRRPLELTMAIQRSLKESLGLTASIELVPANSIERSQGKACRLIDERKA